MEQYNEEDVLEIENAIINQRYKFWLSQRKNFSESANLILSKIKDGYDPNDADVFEICSDNEKQIEEFRNMYKLKQRVKKGKISEEDFNYLVTLIGFDDNIIQLMKTEFLKKGILVDKYEETKKR